MNCGICQHNQATVYMVVTQLPQPGVAKEHVCMTCFEMVRDSFTQPPPEGYTDHPTPATVESVSQQDFNDTVQTAKAKGE